ncbi:hypothetical protein Scep_009050 [Stephania cephalantha]|uniref:HMA domain-containing protein n=1 Tax=Stephania cephalantha TaxID=152367 RepID=A0AAP0JT54_9MAGN
MAAEEKLPEPLKYRTCVLKVSIHCEGCKRKVKKVLRSVEGVYTVTFDAHKHKVTVVGDVEADTLIKKLIKTNKHAELWPEEPSETNKKKKKKKKKKKSKNKEQKDPKSNEEDDTSDDGDDDDDDEEEEGEEENDNVNEEKLPKLPSNGNNGNVNRPTANDSNGKLTVTVTGVPPGVTQGNTNGGSGGKKKKKKKKKKGQSGNNTSEVVEGAVDTSGSTRSALAAQAPVPVNLSPPRLIQHVYSFPSYGGGPPQHHHHVQYIPPTNQVSSYSNNTVHPVASTSSVTRYSQPYTSAHVEPDVYELPSDPLEVYSDEDDEIACRIM